MEGEWSSYRGGHFHRGRMVTGSCYREGHGHVREVASLMEEVASLMWGEWSCYGGGLLKGGRMVML